MAENADNLKAAPIQWPIHPTRTYRWLRLVIAGATTFALFFLTAALFFRLNPSMRSGGMISLIMTPIAMEGLGGFGIVVTAFVFSVKNMNRLRLCLSDNVLVLSDSSREYWSAQIDRIDSIAVVATQDFLSKLVPTMVLIQTRQRLAEVVLTPHPDETAYGPPFLAVTPRSLLVPDVFEVRARKFVAEIVRQAGLSENTSRLGIPSCWRVLQSWSRSTSVNMGCYEDPVAVQRWRLFTGVCPVCRGSLPLLRWFSLNADRVCPHCESKIQRHASRWPTSLAAALITSMVGGVLNRIGAFNMIAYSYPATLIVCQSICLYYLTRSWSRYSSVAATGGYCRECGYDLRGSLDVRCSECGTPRPDVSLQAVGPAETTPRS